MLIEGRPLVDVVRPATGPVPSHTIWLGWEGSLPPASSAPFRATVRLATPVDAYALLVNRLLRWPNLAHAQGKTQAFGLKAFATRRHSVIAR
jgi:hypothetical protein